MIETTFVDGYGWSPKDPHEIFKSRVDTCQALDEDGYTWFTIFDHFKDWQNPILLNRRIRWAIQPRTGKREEFFEHEDFRRRCREYAGLE